MTMHRSSWIVAGALVPGVAGLLGAQTAQGPAPRTAYDTYVPLLERGAPEPSFLNADPTPDESAAADAPAENGTRRDGHAHPRPTEASR